MSGYLDILAKVGRSNVMLVAVTKGHSVADIQKLYNQGARIFGESRVQEALPKQELLPKDIKWHFIGTLQKNKVNKVVGLFDWIHSVDHPELAAKISETSLAKGLKSKILLQVNTSGELSKQGLSPPDWRKSFAEVIKLPGLEVGGLMTMAPMTPDQNRVRKTFASLRLFRDELSQAYHIPLPELSMGMSADYMIAIQEGATMIRVGSALFS